MQLDCPEDAETYIHRVGRTARYHGEGHALLFLLESEREGMLQQLKDLKVGNMPCLVLPFMHLLLWIVSKYKYDTCKRQSLKWLLAAVTLQYN